MKKVFSLFLTVVILWAMTGCGSVPITGRKQMLLVSDSEVMTLSLQQYDEFMKTAPISTDKANTALVQKVGREIANAVETYLAANGMGDMNSSFAWEFNLVKSNDVNAFCMPGGKIVVYEGILPVTKDATGLAVVIGHEVAHAIAKHSNERMSQQMMTQYGSQALSLVTSKSSAATQQIASTVFGLGSQYGVLLPYSRKQELEADELGMIFMAMAGYDPSQASAFWQRMSAAGGASVPEFQSTHPSDATRVKKIEEALPKAMQYYTGKAASAPSKTNSKTSENWKF